MSPGEFCRELETYLCRKNDGHLIRIVGPVFVTVCGWAEQGIPIKIACRGIDRYMERQQARNPLNARRRPVRVEFCEADILDAFDEWRRAVGGLSLGAARGEAGESDAGGGARTPGAPSGSGGIGADGTGGAANGGGTSGDGASGGAAGSWADASAAGDGTDSGAHARRKTGLQTHIDRVMARLTQRRVDAGVSSSLGVVIDRLLGELDTLRAGARGARNETRAALVERLAGFDRELIDAARAALDAAALGELQSEARRELEPFRSRMPPDAWQTATEAALVRLIRERARLPSVHVDD